MSLPTMPGSRRRGFTILELLIAILLIAILATGAAVSMVNSTARIKQTAEAERMVATLRWLRQCALSRSPRWQTGYGMYFWNNRRSFTCVQYSPYTGINAVVPDDPVNTLNDMATAGSPRNPATIGIPQLGEYRSDYADLPPEIAPSMITNGYEIVFQTDVPGQTDLRPVSYPVYPSASAGYAVDRVVFWPAGYRAPVRPGNPWPNEYGVTLPRRGTIVFNRIYIRHTSDAPATYSEAERKPARIHIHPGTGAIRLMEQYEP